MLFKGYKSFNIIVNCIPAFLFASSKTQGTWYVALAVKMQANWDFALQFNNLLLITNSDYYQIVVVYKEFACVFI